ncbi:hypothetical protein PTQ19_09315 [Microbacterium esteraromaticum]|uniref:hypothetical protein n=1 Tax=Microbacterium esteraromaticum TaxID=57043 RepID=UPI00236742D5|nr:hypothetical protein [Microbacterium esteraromaticum]WDH77723.1 hypothetical protein PTQ19_09315 [Microbacterium esteraromaticum]
MDATLLSAPVIAGDVVLAYPATDAGTQTLNAWDLSDGTLLWERITLPGRNLRGQEHQVATLATEDGWQGSTLVPCIAGALEPETDTEHDRVHEYSVADQAFRAHKEADAGFFEGGTAFSSRVSYTDQDVLRYGEHGDLLWERAYADVFGEGTAPSGGWYWSDPSADDAPLLALVFEASPDVDWTVSQEIVRDLTTASVARLDRTSGATEWSLSADSCTFVADFGFQKHEGVATVCQFRDDTRTLHGDGTKVVRAEYVDLVPSAGVARSVSCPTERDRPCSSTSSLVPPTA